MSTPLKPITAHPDFLPFEDFTSNAQNVQAMRVNLRTWFLANLPDWEQTPGSPLADQLYHYQLLDDLLSAYLARFLPTTR